MTNHSYRWVRLFLTATVMCVLLAAGSDIAAAALPDPASQLNGTWTADFTVRRSTNPLAKAGQTLTGLTFSVQGNKITGDLNGTINLTAQTPPTLTGPVYLADVTSTALGPGVSCEGQIFFGSQGSTYVGTTYDDSIKCNGASIVGTLSGYRLRESTTTTSTTTVATTTKPQRPATPAKVTVTETSPGTLRVSWDYGVGDQDSFLVADDAKVDVTQQNPISAFQTVGSDVRSFTVTGATPGKRRCFDVAAWSDDYGNGDWSSTICITPTGHPATTRLVVPPPRQPVPLASVSNGCGGGEVGDSPRFLDEVTFDSGTDGLRFKVRFRQACNVHDAGYGGAVILDPLHGNTKVDFSTWTRRQVDDKFRTDLKQLCDEQLPHADSATSAHTKCRAYADAYWLGVRAAGRKFFDANINTPGDQRNGPRCKSNAVTC